MTGSHFQRRSFSRGSKYLGRIRGQRIEATAWCTLSPGGEFAARCSGRQSIARPRCTASGALQRRQTSGEQRARDLSELDCRSHPDRRCRFVSGTQERHRSRTTGVLGCCVLPPATRTHSSRTPHTKERQQATQPCRYSVYSKNKRCFLERFFPRSKKSTIILAANQPFAKKRSEPCIMPGTAAHIDAKALAGCRRP